MPSFNRVRTHAAVSSQRIVTIPDGVEAYSQWRSGSMGTTESLQFFPDNRRIKPRDLWGNGTSLGYTYQREQNPLVKFSRTTDYWNGYFEIRASEVNGYLVPIASEAWSMNNNLSNRLLKKIKDQNLNLAVSLAEFRSTANTVGDLARSIRGVLLQPKMRLGLRLARKLSRYSDPRWDQKLKRLRKQREKDAVNSYLAYTYGLKPIMSDITGSLNQLNKHLESPDYQYKTVKDKRTITDSYSSAYGTSSSTLTTEVQIKCRYKVDTGVKALSEVGITNPALALYELIPYSFVFDWIIPVGDYLSQLDALVGVSDFQMIEGLKEERIQTTSSGYTLTTITKSRSAPLNRAPSFVLTYSPSSSLKSALNGIMLLKQLR